MREKRPIWNGDEVVVRGYWRRHYGQYCFYDTWVAAHWRKLPYSTLKRDIHAERAFQKTGGEKSIRIYKPRKPKP